MSVQILIGDALARLRELPSDHFHACVTSPPYWALRDYQAAGQIGLEATPDDHVAVLVEVFREVRRVLRPDGTMWMNYGDCYATGAGAVGECPGGGKQGEAWKSKGTTTALNRMPVPGLKPKDLVGMPWRVAFGLQRDGWYLRSDCVWCKPNPMPESAPDRPTKAHEYVFLLSRSRRYFYDSDAVREITGREAEPEEYLGADGHNAQHGNRSGGVGAGFGSKRDRLTHPEGRNLRTVWEIPIDPYRGAHFATFPRALARTCILASTPAAGVCSHCGAPFKRRIQAIGGTKGRSWHDHTEDPVRGQRKAPTPDYARLTVGWDPGCTCPPLPSGLPRHAPARVLDPFGGAGTTGLVADQLGRDCTLIELNPEYAKMAKLRIINDAPLFVACSMDGGDGE